MFCANLLQSAISDYLCIEDSHGSNFPDPILTMQIFMFFDCCCWQFATEKSSIHALDYSWKGIKVITLLLCLDVKIKVKNDCWQK